MAPFWDLLFVLFHCYIVKLAFKLGLKMQNIANTVIKEKIELVWANRTISLLDELFQNNSE